MKKRILFIVSSMQYGGAERVVSILSEEFAKAGHTVDILVTSGKRGSAYPLPDAVSLYYGEKDVTNKEGVGFMWRTIRNIRKHIKDSKPDVVLAFMTWQIIYTVFAAKGLKVPIIISERNDPATIDGKKGNKWLFRLRDYCYGKADGAVFQTKGASEFFPYSIRKKSCVIMNPLDVDALPKYFTARERDNRIVTVGRLSKQKNQGMLLKAFEKINKAFPKVRLCIYGDGEEKEALIALAETLGIREKVDFEGNVSDIQQKIMTASVFAFSSDYEGLPNALIEAMAVGLPCVSTDCAPGGAAALIRDGENGRLVPCGDADAMAEALTQILSDKRRADYMGNEAWKIRWTLRSDKIASEWLRFIDRICSERRS